MSASAKGCRVGVESMKFLFEIDLVTRQFPSHEMFGLSTKLQRAVGSLRGDIATGRGNRTDREFEDRLMHARNTLLEVQTQLMIANELQYISDEQARRLVASADTMSRKLASLVKSFHNRVA
jgi:four helix bundle protein